MVRKFYFIPLSDKDRMRVDITIEKGKVKNFVIQLEAMVLGGWKAVVRYNYAHGFPHKDIMLSDGSKAKERIPETDLNEVVKYAINDIKQNWENYLKRCGYAQD
ncbi:MAG: hypothetical protein HY929_05665 [Euryarchaeota archaeon]|nr:hypothetical protein [Euryarchaeota archaeon]